MDQPLAGIPIAEAPADLGAGADLDAIPPAQFAVRALLVAVQIVIVIYLGQPGALFFYQLF